MIRENPKLDELQTGYANRSLRADFVLATGRVQKAVVHSEIQVFKRSRSQGLTGHRNLEG